METLHGRLKNEELDITSNSIKLDKKVVIMDDCFSQFMIEHAKILGDNDIDIIEIGFGMGFFANYIQNNYNVKSHTIVEINPTIIKEIKEWMKDKSNVILIEGDWFEKQDEIKKRKYDSIYYDAVLDKNVNKFKDLLMEIKKDKYKFSYFENRNVDKFNFGDKVKTKTIRNKLKSEYLIEDRIYYIPYVEFNQDD